MPPHLLSINPSEEWWEWKHHCSDSEHIFADESELSSQMAVLESENNGLRNNRTRCPLPLFMLMWALAGRHRILLWEPIQFWTQCYFLKPDRITFVPECPFSTHVMHVYLPNLPFELHWICPVLDGLIESVFTSLTDALIYTLGLCIPRQMMLVLFFYIQQPWRHLKKLLKKHMHV